MPLQNRVDPFGRLIAVSARGTWMGNRGLLHDKHQVIRRPYRLNAWLICQLEFRGRRRTVMSPGLYTELFFLDEATALAAGHRPCFECRRADYLAFKAAAETGVGATLPKVADLDARLRADRMKPDGSQNTYRAAPNALPDGAFICWNGEPWLLWRGEAHRWTPAGYAEKTEMPSSEVDVLTPRLSVEAIRAGYAPQTALP